MISTIITVILIAFTVTCIAIAAMSDYQETKADVLVAWFAVTCISAAILADVPVRSETIYAKPTYINKDSSRVLALLPNDLTFTSSEYKDVISIDSSTQLVVITQYNYYGIEIGTRVSKKEE